LPFGGAFRPRWWCALWTRLGVRTSILRDRTHAQTIETIYQYGKTGLKYLTLGEVSDLLTSIFAEVRMVETDFIKYSVGPSHSLAPLMQVAPWLLSIYRRLHTHVVLVRK